MFGNMKGKLQEMQQQTEEVKKRLDTISVSEEVEGGKVRVIAYASKRIGSIEIAPELLQSGAEEVEDLVTLCVNRALEKAGKVAESEMQAVAQGMLPNFPGLF